MGELPTDLYKRCRDLLSKCDEFESNESVQSVFTGTEIKDYSRYVNEKRKPDDRISEVIRADESQLNRLTLTLVLVAKSDEPASGRIKGSLSFP
jgi:hypothetical protein